jgi:ribonuclease BN (tRNA processing enzyme)
VHFLKLQFLGSGGSAVSAKRACPSILVDESAIFDLGPGALGNLRRSRVDTNRLTAVFISHCHADHISDLIPFLWAIQIDGRKKPLKIVGPPGFERIFHRLRECTNTPDTFFTFPLTVTDVQFGEKLDNVETCRTDHSIPTLAFRVLSDGRSICYTADTTYSPTVVEFARNVDLLVHEATFLEDQAPIAELTRHSTARMAGRSGREADAKRLALFHIPPPNEHREEEFRSQASQEYGGDVMIATDLAQIEL